MRLRTFISVDPGQAVRDQLVRLQENFVRGGVDMKWVEPENLHLTLLFLGEVDQRDVLGVCRAVEQAAQAFSAIELSVEGTGCFPNARRPRILWVGVGKGSEEMIALHAALEAPLLELGCYRREERAFTPHITLGRTRTEAPGDKLTQALQKYQRFHAGEATIREVHVMNSEMSSHGPKYTVMSRSKLK